MKYLLLIYDKEAVPQEQKAPFAAWETYTADLKNSGAMLGGQALQPTSTATTVRLRDGKRLTTDGPFAETKEQLGGFYMVDCKDLDEAIELAGKIPSAPYGSVEVRPIMEF